MVFSIRRVVTGHDAAGRAVVAIDEIAANLVSRRPGHTSYVIWSNDTTPADNDEDGDAARHRRLRTGRRDLPRH